MDEFATTPPSLSADEFSDGAASDVELSREVCEELLDPKAWDEVLNTYAGTVGLAVALTDRQGRQSGICHNAQPTWLMAHEAAGEYGAGSTDACSFCLDAEECCEAVKTALKTGRVELARDRAGFVHLAVPLMMGGNPLGALIAGQVFDRYPEPLQMQRLARNLHLSAQDLWQRARMQSPVRTATLQVYGELLRSLGNAFLRQRYAAILDRQLATTNLRLRLLLGGVKDYALFTLDESGLVTSWNSGAERMFAHTASEVIGQDFSRLFKPEDVQNGVPARLLQQARRDGSVNDQSWQVRKDGTGFFAESSLSILGKGASREFGRLTHDVTDRMQAEDALRQAQKLESIGVLASGIAHDFNNLLTCMLGGVSFAMTSLPTDHPSYPSLVIAAQAGEKAADLTHQLLAYAGHGKFIVTQFDLSVLIGDMLRLLQTSIPKHVQLQLALERDLPWIEADASQIQQVAMNLVINGAESIGPEGGTLRVSTGSSPAEKENDTGMEVWLEVRDSGSGMTEATRARIFDPFYTTKSTGRGLGLAAVSGIVRGHGGRMEVESAVGKGTTFRICFPAVKRRAEPKEGPALRRNEYGCSTVLVVDDEPALRSLAKSILERNGYKVIVAENGREAVEMFRQHAGSISSVLLDITMPVMGGAEAFRQIRAISADVPIVMSTGYSEITTRELFEADAVVGFIQKPYTAARLVEEIRTIHDAA